MGLDGTAFESGVKRASSLLTRFANHAASDVKSRLSQAFSVGALENFVRKTIEYGHHIANLAEQFGLTTDQMQKLDAVANRTGIGIDMIGHTLLRIGEFRQRLADGDEKSLAIMKRMGLSSEEFLRSGTDNLEIGMKITDAYSASAKTTQQINDLTEVGGVRSERILVALKEMHQIGPIELISKEDLETIKELGNQLKEWERRAVVAASPYVAQVGRVVKRGTELDDSGAHLALSQAILEEAWGKHWAKTIGKRLVGTRLGVPDLFERFDATRTDDTEANAALTPEELAKKKRDIAAENERIKGKPKEYERHAEQSSLSGGSLRSIGGFLYDSFDDKQPLRQIVTFTEKTADAAKRSADTLESLRRNQ